MQEVQAHGFDPSVGRIPWRRKWQPTPVILPGISYGRRSLAGYSPWGRTESDMTERLSTQSVMIVLSCVYFHIKDTVLFPVTSQLSDSQDWDLKFKVRGFDVKN